MEGIAAAAPVNFFTTFLANRSLQLKESLFIRGKAPYETKHNHEWKKQDAQDRPNHSDLYRVGNSGRVALNQYVVRDFVNILRGACSAVARAIQEVGQFLDGVHAPELQVLGGPKKGPSIAASGQFPR